MKIVFFTFYFPPDLSAGSFRSIAFSQSLKERVKPGGKIDIITSHPNRYKAHLIEAQDVEFDEMITIHRINVPSHTGSMFSQGYAFLIFAISAFNLCRKINPDFLIGTSSRLMTAALTWISAIYLKKRYFIDLRDIFSETISDIFMQKNRLLGLITKHFFIKLEKYVLNSAAGVNVVSEGFPEYFENNGIDTSNWFFFPNGVDQNFVDFPAQKTGLKKSIKTILYAGNIGKGQGLEKVIPVIAKSLGFEYQIKIIGDGGSISLLRDLINKENIQNVELISPVGRIELTKYYLEADILFLHLNNIPAFKRVLPSKIFEYAALGRPIVAGLNGYSAKFMRQNIPHALIFPPGDSKGAVKCILDSTNIKVSRNIVNEFVSKYLRVSIMDELTHELIGCIEDTK
jgi:glycosyltransferase involved in cell wall biosynthesis